MGSWLGKLAGAVGLKTTNSGHAAAHQRPKSTNDLKSEIYAAADAHTKVTGTFDAAHFNASPAHIELQLLPSIKRLGKESADQLFASLKTAAQGAGVSVELQKEFARSGMTIAATVFSLKANTLAEIIGVFNTALGSQIDASQYSGLKFEFEGVLR